MKIKEIQDLTRGLSELSAIKLPFKLSYRVSRIANKIEAENKAINKAIEVLILENGGEPLPSGGFQIKQPGEKASKKEIKEFEDNLMKYKKGFEELMETESGITEIDKIPFSLFPEDLEIKSEILSLLSEIIEEEK